jgi:hypothetical protein
MTKSDRKSRGVKDSTTELPWRPFNDRPTGIWIDETGARIKETAQPELIESLYRNHIPKDARFRVLKHLITVDGIKRPQGDNCPCPMCTPNRFLTGSLVWFPELQFCAFIGNCCANDDVLAEAEKERKWRDRRDSEEDYLLAALPLVGPKLTVVESLKPVACHRPRKTGKPACLRAHSAALAIRRAVIPSSCFQVSIRNGACDLRITSV